MNARRLTNIAKFTSPFLGCEQHLSSVRYLKAVIFERWLLAECGCSLGKLHHPGAVAQGTLPDQPVLGEQFRKLADPTRPLALRQEHPLSGRLASNHEMFDQRLQSEPNHARGGSRCYKQLALRHKALCVREVGGALEKGKIVCLARVGENFSLTNLLK